MNAIMFDWVRVIALMPIRDFETNPESVKIIHRRVNLAILGTSPIIMLIFIFARWKECQSAIDFWVNFFTSILIALFVMWTVGALFQTLQSLDIANQPNTRNPINQGLESIISKAKDDMPPMLKPDTISTQRKRGRPKKSCIKEGNRPTKNDFAQMGMDTYFNELNEPLSSIGAKNFIKALQNDSIKSDYLADDYSEAALADWLIVTYRQYIRKSVTTAGTIKSAKSKGDEVDDVVKSLIDRLKNRNDAQ